MCPCQTLKHNRLDRLTNPRYSRIGHFDQVEQKQFRSHLAKSEILTYLTLLDST